MSYPLLALEYFNPSQIEVTPSCLALAVISAILPRCALTYTILFNSPHIFAAVA